jgi:dihydrodipicolinate synthase/N-acetylneuraminate lyase
MSVKRYPACILATCCIPWNEDGTLMEEVFRREIRDLQTNFTQDLYIFGTAGEGYAVTDKQFDQIARIFREETNRPDVRGMVGVISLSLPTTIERLERAREMGFRHFQISLPAWGALTDRELNVFFKETCGRFPDCSFLHYNLLRTKRLITPEEYALLADKHPNLVATKNSTDSMERIQGFMTKAPQLQHFFTETGFAYGSQLGECGFLASVAVVHFQEAKNYFEAGRQRELKNLLRQQSELAEMIQEIVALGRSEAHMDGAFDKVFCKIRNRQFPLHLLPPYSSLSEETFHKICELIQRKFPQWNSQP